MDAYSYANPSDPIVRGLIASSGVISQINRQNTSAFSAVAARFGCSNGDEEAELGCMQAVDPIELRSFIRSSASPRFGPSADNVTLFENNTARAERGKVAKVVGEAPRRIWVEGSSLLIASLSLLFWVILSTREPLSLPQGSITPKVLMRSS